MQNKILLSALLFVFTLIARAQTPTINPVQTTEVCPGVNITFTVTIPAAQSIQSVQPWALNVNPVVIQQPFNVTSSGGNITFNFIGRFSDYNNKQTFRVFYTNSSGVATTWDATYIKIKSLLTANSFSQIYPSPTSITAQRCQTQNFNISFSNVQYGNPWEAPPIGYGTVTNYEYLLPAGWSLNGTPSTGNWMTGNNNVTVSSDPTSGVGGSIRIRPINTQCASGLVAGQEATIAINRPAPTLSITGGLDVICTGNSTYTVSGLTTGATVVWAISDPSIATIPNPSTGNSVTVTQVGTGVVTLTATVTDCIQTYTPVTKQITLGIPPIDKIIVQGQRFNYTPNGPLLYYTVCASESIDLFPNVPFPPNQITTNEWQWLSGGYQILGATNYFGLYVYTSASIRNVLELRYRYTNACGTSGWQNVSIESMDCDNGEEPYRINPNKIEKELLAVENSGIYPNPVKSTLIVNIADNNPKGYLSLLDINGRQVYQAKIFGQRNLINVSSFSNGIYLLKLVVNGKTETRRIVISK